VCWFQRRSGERARVRSLALRAPRACPTTAHSAACTLRACIGGERCAGSTYTRTYHVNANRDRSKALPHTGAGAKRKALAKN